MTEKASEREAMVVWSAEAMMELAIRYSGRRSSWLGRCYLYPAEECPCLLVTAEEQPHALVTSLAETVLAHFRGGASACGDGIEQATGAVRTGQLGQQGNQEPVRPQSGSQHCQHASLGLVGSSVAVTAQPPTVWQGAWSRCGAASLSRPPSASCCVLSSSR
jgi:hypothetical protein